MFDVRGVDIIGLRLGMGSTEMTNRLAAQGYHVERQRDALVTHTIDGLLTIELAPDGSARLIRYVFNQLDTVNAERFAQAIEDRFGPPDQTKHMAWCLQLDNAGRCPAQHASLTLWPTKRTMVLRVGTSDAR
jgi:hypothetical protein